MSNILTKRTPEKRPETAVPSRRRLDPAPNGRPVPGVQEPWILPTIGMLAILCIAPIWMCEYFPSQNGPSLLHIAFAQSHLDNPTYGFSEYFGWHPFPVPYLFQTTVLTLLFPLFTPVVAEKLFITAVLLLRPASMIYLLRGLGRGREIYALACLPLLYDFSLMRGYFNYHAGVSVGMIILGYYIRHRARWTTRSTLVFQVLVLVHYFTHPVALAVFGLLLAAYEFAVSRSPARIIEIVYRGYIPSLLLLGCFLVWSSMYGAWVEADVAFLSVSDKIQNIYFRGATPLSGTANAVSLALLGFVGGIGAADMAQRYGRFGFREVYINPGMFIREPMLVALIAATGLYMLMPWEFLGWHKADVRIIPVLFMLVLALPSAPASRRRRVVFSAVTASIVVAMLVPISKGLQQASHEIGEYVAGSDSVPMRSKILPLWPNADPDEDWGLEDAVDPTIRASAYYTIRRGGATNNSLAVNNTLYFLWYDSWEDGSGFPDVNVGNATAQQVRRAAKAYDAVLLWDDLERIETMFEQNGFRESFKEGRMTVLVKEHHRLRKVSSR